MRTVLLIDLSLAVVLLLVSFFFRRPTLVHGSSMMPTIRNGEVLLLNMTPKARRPHRGDIVVVFYPEALNQWKRRKKLPSVFLLKRVIALEGETVEVRDKLLLINGEVLCEEYLPAGSGRNIGPVTVPDGHCYVMGDNRLVSRDSRSFGPVPVKHIFGRAISCIYPLAHRRRFAPASWHPAELPRPAEPETPLSAHENPDDNTESTVS